MPSSNHEIMTGGIGTAIYSLSLLKSDPDMLPKYIEQRAQGWVDSIMGSEGYDGGLFWLVGIVRSLDIVRYLNLEPVNLKPIVEFISSLQMSNGGFGAGPDNRVFDPQTTFLAGQLFNIADIDFPNVELLTTYLNTLAVEAGWPRVFNQAPNLQSTFYSLGILRLLELELSSKSGIEKFIDHIYTQLNSSADEMDGSSLLYTMYYVSRIDLILDNVPSDRQGFHGLTHLALNKFIEKTAANQISALPWMAYLAKLSSYKMPHYFQNSVCHYLTSKLVQFENDELQPNKLEVVEVYFTLIAGHFIEECDLQAQTAGLVSWLRDQQESSGGFITAGMPEIALLDVSSSAIMGLDQLNSNPIDPVAAKEFILRCLSDKPGFNLLPGDSPLVHENPPTNLKISFQALAALAVLGKINAPFAAMSLPP